MAETAGHIGSFNTITCQDPHFLHLQGTNCSVDNQASLPPPKPVFKSMPSSSPYFVGCEDHLQKLHDYFCVQPANETRRRTFVLFGVGGVGKTQICLKFLEQNQDR
jgi:hypothetical protein